MPDLKSILDASPVDNRVRADAWDAFHAAGDENDFRSRFDTLPLPQEVKADLWDLKFGGGSVAPPAPAPAPVPVPQRQEIQGGGTRELGLPGMPRAPLPPGLPPPIRPGEHGISARPTPKMGWLGEISQRGADMVMGGDSGETLLSRLGAKGDPKLRALVKDALPLRHTPLFRFEELTPERGPARAVAQFASGLTTPENAALAAGMGKLKAIPEVGAALAKAASGGFSVQMLTGALASDPEWAEAKAAGDKAVMSEIVFRKGLELVFGGLAGKHATSGARPIERGAAPPPTEADRLQRYSSDAARQSREFSAALKPGEAPPPQPPAPAPKGDLITGRTPEAQARFTRPAPPGLGDEALVNAAMDQLERAQAQPSPVTELTESERMARYGRTAGERGAEFADATGRTGERGAPEEESPATGYRITGRTPEANARFTRPSPPGIGDEQLIESAMDQLEGAKKPLKSFVADESGEQRVPEMGEVREGLGKMAGLISRILQVHQSMGGSTFNVRNEQNLAGERMYSVSPFKDLEKVLDHSPTSEDITSFVSQPGVREKLFDPSGKYSLGTWEDSSTGKTYLDVVLTTPDFSEAMEIGKRAKQLAMFDLSKVDPRTGDVADGAEIAIPAEPVETKKLYHWSRQPNLETLDPRFYGTAEAGAEMRRKRNAGPDWVDRTYYAETQASHEPHRFGPGTKSPFPYEVEVPADRIYDLTKDPEGILAAEGDITLAEKRVRDLGYAGYKGAYPDGTPAYAMFEPLKAKSLSERLDEAANNALARIRERQASMPKESLLTGESGVSIGELNATDYAIWGAAKLMKGAVNFTSWSKEMVRDLGEQIRPELEKLYAKSKSILARHIEHASLGLPSTRKLLTMYKQGKEGEKWYQESQEEVQKFFGDDAPTFLNMLAATSPNNSVEGNLTLALKAYRQWKTGEPFTGYYPAVKRFLERITSGEIEWANPETAPKVYNFRRNLRGEEDPVTVDKWIHRAFGFPTKAPSAEQYKFIDYAITQIARDRGIPPREFQAAIWKSIKDTAQEMDFTSESFGAVVRRVIEQDPELSRMLLKAREAATESEMPDWVTAAPEGGGVGEFWRDEAGTMRVPSIKEVREGLGKVAEWYERKIINDLGDIRRFTADANLAPEQDPYVLAMLHAGRGGKMVRRLTRKDSLREIIRPAYKEGLYQDMVDYSLLERYQELAKPKSQGGHEITRFPNGLTLADIQAQKTALEARLGPQKLAKVKGYVDKLYRYSDQILQEARDGGLISAETYRRIKARNEKYVPLQRIAYLYDQLEQVRPGSNIFSVPTQDLVKEIAGSNKDVLNPIQGIIRNTIKSVALVSRNKVALAMANLANDSRFQGSVIRLKKGMQAPDGMDVFSVLRDGRKEVYAAPKLVVEAMKRMSPEQGDLVTRFMAASSGFLKAGAVTFNMAFIPANAIRDFATATLKSEVGFYPWDWVRGLSRAVFKGDVYDKYLESGGAFGGLYESLGKGGEMWELNLATGKRSKNRLAQFEREMKGEFTLRRALTLANPLEYVRIMGQIIEQAPRIGAFERAMRQGMSQEGAGFLSRDVTVNFSKAGSAMRVLNLWVPFLNARQQGLINVIRGVKHHPGRAAMILAATVGVPAITSYLHNTRNHKDVWDDIADFEKRNNFIFIFGDERDEDGNPTQVVKIPKGDVGQMVGNPLEHFLAWMDGKEPERIDKLAVQWLSDASPIQFEREGELSGLAVASSVTPPTPKGILEGVTNKNFYTGRDIVPQKNRLQEASPREQYWTNTPPAVVSVAQFLGVSPLKLQNFIGTQFGGLGRQIMEPTKAQKSVTRRFVGAHGGGKEERQFEAFSDIKREGADEAVRSNREVQKLFDSMLKAQPRQRQQMVVDALRSGKINEDGIEKLADLIEAKALGLSDFERYLKGAPLADRAKYMVKRMRELPPAERAKTFARWEEKGLLTDELFDQIVETAAAEGR